MTCHVIQDQLSYDLGLWPLDGLYLDHLNAVTLLSWEQALVSAC